MAIETFEFIDDLVAANPTATDNVSEGDDHLRGLKTTLKNTFPNVDAAVTPTATELNYVDGVTSSIQTQLGTLTTGLGNVNTDLVNDTTPQLGGDLDLNGHAITGLASNALKTDFTVEVGKTVAAADVVNFAAGKIGSNPVVNTQSSLVVDGSHEVESQNASGTIVLRSYQDGAHHYVMTGTVHATTGVITWNTAVDMYNAYSDTNVNIKHSTGDKFWVWGKSPSSGSSNPCNNWIMGFSVNPSTGAITKSNQVNFNFSAGSNKYNYSSISGNLSLLSTPRVIFRQYQQYYDGGWLHLYYDRFVIWSDSGNLTDNTGDHVGDGSVLTADVDSSSKLLSFNSSDTNIFTSPWNGTQCTSDTATAIQFDSTFSSADSNRYRVVSIAAQRFIMAFKNTSDNLVLNTYNYANGVYTKAYQYIVVTNGAGVSVGDLKVSGTDVVLGYEDNSKGYIATFTITSSGEVSGIGIPIQHNGSNEAVKIAGPFSTNKWTAYINTGSKANSSIMTANAYATGALNWLGVAEASGVAGATVSVIIDGVAGGFTGLTVGATYYYDTSTYSGTVTTTITDYLVGTALSTTEIKLNA